MNAITRRGLLVGTAAATTLLAFARIGEAAEAPAPSSPEFAPWVMDRIDDMHRGLSSHGVMEMTVQTRHFTRTMRMESWTRGEDYTLVRILSPKKERGTATLKAKDDLFTYLAKTGRTIKITGAMMGSSWMGSHLDNNDLVKSSRVADDYDLVLTGKGTLEGVPHWVITATAKADAAVVWGKIEVAVRQKDLMPTRQIFLDEDGKAIRSMEFLDYREESGRTLAGKMLVRPLDGSGEQTTVTFESIEFDVEVPDSTFTLQHLKSM